MMSDESENDGVYTDSYENDIYYKKYKLLLDECAQLQKSNEILVFRIQEVNKIVRRRQKEVKFFKKRLQNNYGEDWAVIPNLDIVKDEEETKSVAYLMLKDKIKEEKVDETEKPKPAKKPTKRKSAKTEKDPKAPKRPSNPFFQFCQEQRQILMEQLNAELKPGEAELTKQELTRQLAIKWKSLSGSDKKASFEVYVDMYERSKEKYAAELSEYNMKK
ncbi:high mobility group B protein 13-like [Asbolus verrucosus]|uniref:High mobility group B protein 13-like n=1 Tax=Asbolus verrucosus TaxID=1661398 RepID=A0A482VYE4_ASBVE|nr:high mobility group B protein 13-like [Asbolus verrucosus]